MGKLIQINQELQARLQHYEMAFEQIRLENIIMQDKLLQMGINVLDLVKANCNGSLKMIRSPSGSPPQRSTPQRSPTEHASPILGAYPLLPPPGLLQSHVERFVKKERDGCTWESCFSFCHIMKLGRRIILGFTNWNFIIWSKPVVVRSFPFLEPVMSKWLRN